MRPKSLRTLPTFDPTHEAVAAVWVLQYRLDAARKPRPAALFLYVGGSIAGTPDMMATANLKLAQDIAAIVVFAAD